MNNNILPFEYRQPRGRSHKEDVRKGMLLLEAFQAIIESTSDSIFLTDREGRYILLNQAYSSMFGLPVDQMIGKKYSAFHSPKDSRSYYKSIERVFQTGESLQQEYFPPEGTRIFLQTFSPVLSSGPAREITSVSVIAKDITHSRYMDKALLASEEKTRNLLESIDDSYYEVDLQGNFTFLNRSAQRRIGENSRRYYLDTNFRAFMSDEDAKRILKIFNDVYHTGMARSEIPLDFATEQGFRNLEISVSPIKDAQNAIIGFRGISRDVTDRNLLLERVRQSEERYRNIVENIEDGYYEIDVMGRPLFCNDAYLKIIGYSRQEWLSTHFTDYVDTVTANRLNNTFMRILQTGLSRSGIEWDFTARDGQVKNLEETVSLIKDAKGDPLGFRGLVRDVTKRKNHDAMIKHLAYHDFLTGLPNRLLFFDRIHMALEQAKRNKHSLAVMEIDLDGFKAINDTYGHNIGDLLLQSVAGILKNAVRRSDTVARMGGDEFIILLPEIKEERSTGKIAAKILKAFDQCFQLDGRNIFITPSIGIAVFPKHGQDADHLIKHADNAMYRVKESGKNDFQI